MDFTTLYESFMKGLGKESEKNNKFDKDKQIREYVELMKSNADEVEDELVKQKEADPKDQSSLADFKSEPLKLPEDIFIESPGVSRVERNLELFPTREQEQFNDLVKNLMNSFEKDRIKNVELRSKIDKIYELIESTRKNNTHKTKKKEWTVPDSQLTISVSELMKILRD